ncbi:MAG TPA: hypothetical protein VNR36_12025 [Pseudolysinimonas sp.]|nr:hypothetical protein [Pseudolysinimonas sp.]
MELLYVTVIGAGIGAVVRYLIPGRRAHGMLLLPAIGAAVTSALWVGLLWLGLTFDGGWIWVISLGAATLASIAAAIWLARARERGDRRLLHQLSGGKA